MFVLRLSLDIEFLCHFRAIDEDVCSGTFGL